jgi:hypothetical protein
MTNELLEQLESLPVFVYKIVDGTTIFAIQLSATLNYHLLAYPLTATFSDNGYTLDPYIIGATDTKHYINATNIISFSELLPEFKSEYQQYLISTVLLSNLDSFKQSIPDSVLEFLGLIKS